VKHAIKAVLHMVDSNDRVAVVAFNKSAHVVFELTRISSSGMREKCIAKLENLRPSGQTNLWAGILAGMTALNASELHRPKTLLLLTDGVPNISPPRGHIEELRAYRECHPQLFRSFQMHTFGFGYQLDSALLLDLATVGNGAFAFIPDSVIVGTNFVNSVANLLCNVHANCKLHIRAKGNAKITNGPLGNYRVDDQPWGKVIDIGVLQCGQRRSFVIPMKIPDGHTPYLEAHLTYHHSALESTSATDLEYRVSIMASNRVATPNAAYALLRCKLVSCGLFAVKKPGEKAQRDLCILAQEMKTSSSYLAKLDDRSRKFSEQIDLMRSDVAGRMSKALKGVSRFKRWGRHYLRSISRNHQLQLCANFMDPGLQNYGGSLFQSLRDRGDKIFLSLPLPQVSKPSTKTSTTRSQSVSPRPTTQTYYAGSGGGCFGALSTVMVLRNGTLHPTLVSHVKRGDKIAVSSEGSLAEVRCVAR